MTGKAGGSVRTASHEVKLTFILCFGSNRNAFYLYMGTSVASSSTPCYVHAWVYKGCGYLRNYPYPAVHHYSTLISEIMYIGVYFSCPDISSSLLIILIFFSLLNVSFQNTTKGDYLVNALWEKWD